MSRWSCQLAKDNILRYMSLLVNMMRIILNYYCDNCAAGNFRVYALDNARKVTNHIRNQTWYDHSDGVGHTMRQHKY